MPEIVDIRDTVLPRRSSSSLHLRRRSRSTRPPRTATPNPRALLDLAKADLELLGQLRPRLDDETDAAWDYLDAEGRNRALAALRFATR